MSFRKRVRCGKCKAVLQFTLRTNAAVQVTCVRCGAVLKIPASSAVKDSPKDVAKDATDERKDAIDSGFRLVESRNDFEFDYDQSDIIDDQDVDSGGWDDFPDDTLHWNDDEAQESAPSQLPPRKSSVKRKREEPVAPTTGAISSLLTAFKNLPMAGRLGIMLAGVVPLVVLVLLGVFLLVDDRPELATVGTNEFTNVQVMSAANSAATAAVSQADLVDLDIKNVHLQKSYDQLAVNETTRELAGIVKGSNELHVYEATSLRQENPQPVTYTIPGACQYMVFKPVGSGGYYCILDGAGAILFVDAEKKSSMRAVEIGRIAIDSLLASKNPEDPWIFVVKKFGNPMPLMAIHVETGQLVELVGTVSGNTALISDSGHWIAGNSTILSRKDLKRPPSNLPRRDIQWQVNLPDNLPLFFAHHDQFLVKGDTIVDTVAGAQTIVTLKNNALRPVAPRCAFRDLPVMIGTWVPDRNTRLPIEHAGQILLNVASTNTFTRFPKNYRLDFSPDWNNESGATGHRAPNMPASTGSQMSGHAVDARLKLLPDNTNRQLYCVLGRKVKIVPAADLAGTDTQPIDFPTIASGPYPPGRPVRVPLGKSNTPVKTSVETPLPEGAAVESEEFVWTPTKVQTGLNVLTFVYDSEDSHRSLNVKVDIDYPLAAIPGTPEHIIAGAATGTLYSLETDLHTIVKIDVETVNDVPDCIETARFQTGAKIVSFTEKQFGSASFLCVATDQPNAIHVLESDTLKKRAEIPVKLNSIQALHVSLNPADPYVYYSTRSEMTGAIDLSSLSDAGIVSGLKGMTLISPDGRIANDSKRGIALLDSGFSGRAPQFSPWMIQNKYVHIAEKPIMDSQSTIIAASGKAYSLFRSETGVLVPDSIVYLEDDFAVTMKLGTQDVTLTRRNYGPEPATEHSFTVSLPMSTRTQGGRVSSVGNSFARVDVAHDRIIVCRGGRLAIQPLSSLGIGKEPPMNAAFVPGTPFVAGNSSTQTLKPLHADDVLEIESLADGMQVNGNEITWKPGRNQLGNNLIQYRVRRGERVVNRTAFVSVAGSRYEAEMMMAAAGKTPPGGAASAEKPGNESPAMAAIESVGEFVEPGTTVAMASNFDAGTTLVLCEKAPQIRLFRTAEIESGPVGTGSASQTLNTPALDVVAKQIGQQQTFVILAGGKGHLSYVHVLDAKTLMEIRKLPLDNVEGCTALTTSEAADDPWTFCIASRGDIPNAPGTLAGLNLETGSVVSAIADDVDQATLSADGKSLVLAGQGADSLRWMTRVTPFAADSQWFIRWKSSPGTSTSVVLSPLGDFVLCGTDFRDFGLEDFGAKLPIELLSPVFLRHRAALVGIQEETRFRSTTEGTTTIQLKVFDAQSFEAVEQSVILDQVEFTKRDDIPNAKTFKLIADDKSGRIVCVTNKEFITVQFDEMKIPAAGYLATRFHSDPTFYTGSPAEIRLELPATDPPPRITGSQLLPGMELKGTTISWTPDVARIGLSEISITISDGKRSQRTRTVVNVARQKNEFSGNDRFASLSTLDGSLILPDTESRRIIRYKVDGTKLVEDADFAIPLDAPPKILLTKQVGNQHFVLVGFDSTKPLKVFDAGTFKSVGEIAINGWYAGELQTSQNPDDPFVYFERVDGINALSLKTMKDLGLVIPDATNFVIGSSGTFGYVGLRQSGDSSIVVPAVLSSGFQASIPEFSLPMERDGYRNTVHSLIPDEYGMVAIVDGHLQDGFLSQAAAHSGAASSYFGVGFLHRGGTLLSLYRGREFSANNKAVSVRLVASSAYSDAPVYGEIQIAESIQSQPFGRGTPPDWKILPDESNGRILCLRNSEVVIVEIADLAIPKQTPLMGSLSGPHQVEVGRPQTWNLIGVPDDADVRFAILPDGCVQTESQINWTPTNDQIGLHKIRVELKRGQEHKTLEYGITASWPTLTLPFSPVGIATEETGPRVAVWQRSAIVDDRVVDNNCGQLCVVNTASKKQLFSGNMLTRNQLGRIVGGVIAGDRFVFYNRLPDESELWSIPLEGGALAQQMEIPGDRRKSLITLSVIGEHMLVEFTDRLMIFDAATLNFEREIRPAEGMIPRPVVAQSLFGTSLYGVVVDESLAPRLVVRPPWYADPLVKTEARPVAPVAVVLNKDEDSTPKLSRGEMRISVVFSKDASEPDSKTQESTAEVPLPARKLAQHWSHRISGELRFENLLGTILTRPLGKMNFRLFDEFIGCHYYPRAADVAVCAGRRLMLLPFPKPEELKSKGASLVAAVIPETGNVLITTTTKTTLKHKLLGDTVDITAVNKSLQVEGLEYLPNDRSIVIDGTQLKRALTTMRATACLARPGAAGGTPAERAKSIVTELTEQQRAQAEGVLQYKGDGLLEAIPIVIELQDKNQGVVYQLSYFVFVELSPVELENQIAVGLR